MKRPATPQKLRISKPLNGYTWMNVLEKPPHWSLAAAVVINAARDLQREDIVQAMDAMAFFLDEESGAPFWLKELGIELEPNEALIYACNWSSWHAR